MTDNTVELALLTKGIVTNNAVALGVGVDDVYYGDQNRVPRTPSVCVEPGSKTRDLQGAPRRALTSMTVYVIIYVNSISSISINQQAADSLAENVETFLHADAQLGGEVIDSMVETIEYGYAMRSNTLFRVARLRFVATQKVQLPSSV